LDKPQPHSIGCIVNADAWLSEQLRRPCWRVAMATTGNDLAVLAREPRAFAYARVGTANLALVHALSARGFRPVDVAVMFEGPVPAGVCDDIRHARASDREAIMHIAGSTFQYSRFHLDPLIDKQTANDIKAQWAGNFFVGQRGDAMLVAEIDGKVAGFLQLLHQPHDVLLIDLIGVDAALQGRGLARRMIHFAARHVARQSDAARLRVGTQVANTRSVRLYESLGLRLTGSQYVLHFHNIAA
jgi:ribosomal protein S18 acetylase RimI-like enzyme